MLGLVGLLASGVHTVVDRPESRVESVHSLTVAARTQSTLVTAVFIIADSRPLGSSLLTFCRRWVLHSKECGVFLVTGLLV